ncbi:lysozyme inhibitor LprI family protein [Paraherbaspirillum soli]|uniref:Lysozyme inhibitor LprI family protein n=1 Tax=Paraherbaspirillum soli TaxID=631222 RepID=A0ABW0MAE1_9BURK
MKKILLLILLAAASVANASPRYAPPDGEVLTELSRRSNLPEADLRQSLAKCDANQTNTNLCAYRDQVAADLALKHVVAEKVSRLPKRAQVIDDKVAKWEKSRDASCAKSAEREWGNGSMKPAAQAMCVTAETKKMIRWAENLK